MSLRSIVVAGMFGLAFLSARAADVEPGALNSMRADARQAGATPVLVTLTNYSLQELAADANTVRKNAADKAKWLLQELGAEAWDGARSDTGYGSLDLYVTDTGLAILAQSANAKSFRAGKPWHARMSGGGDGRHEAIALQIRQQGYADVTVAFNNDDADFDLAVDGAGRSKTTPRGAVQAAAKARALLASLSEADSVGTKQAALKAADRLDQLASTQPSDELALRVNLRGVLKLFDSAGVRNIKPVGYKDPRAPSFDDEALTQADYFGKADVLVTIRNPFDGGHRSNAAYNAYVNANRRILRSLLSQWGLPNATLEFPEFSAVGVTLTAQQLRAVKAGNDQRIVSVVLNKPVAKASLANSTAVQMNMGTAWGNSAYWATGQNIVVMDTGVQAGHLMLQTPSGGTSRITSEACFGSNGTALKDGKTVTYRSNCTTDGGQSFTGTTNGPGTAAPVEGCVTGATTITNSECAHGTNVASIAASIPVQLSQTGPTYLGVAYGANIAAYQVFSYDTSKSTGPTAFLYDVLRAMQRVVGLTTAGTTKNPWTVNMSLGSGLYSGSCFTARTLGTDGNSSFSNYMAFTTAVDTLKSRGVPVVAATGNDGVQYSITWPACVPGVIKVAALVNDGAGSAISKFGATGGSNLANPTFFPGETFWFAPGGGAATNALSAAGSNTFIQAAGFATLSTTTKLAHMAGTSQATPHITGVYAIIKGAVPGVSVDGIYSTLLNFGAVLPGPTFTANDCNGQPSPSLLNQCVNRQVRYNKVRLP